MSLKEFKPIWLTKSIKCLFIGSSDVGKTTCIKSLLPYQSNGLCICSYENYEEYFTNTKKVYNLELIKDFCNHSNEHIVLDNCIFNINEYLHLSELINNIDNMLFLTIHYPISNPFNFITPFDFIFIFRNIHQGFKKRLYEQYNGGVFNDYQHFCSILEKYTKDNSCLVIHRSSSSNKLEDYVFWYKAPVIAAETINIYNECLLRIKYHPNLERTRTENLEKFNSYMSF